MKYRMNDDFKISTKLQRITLGLCNLFKNPHIKSNAGD